MVSTKELYNGFINHLNTYIEQHGVQNILEIKQLAKNYCIQSRNGVYDLTAKNRYCTVFLTYCAKSHIEFPEGWDIMVLNRYDPDNDSPDDQHLIKLKEKDDARRLQRVRQYINYRRERGEIVEDV
jgi:hypothetical protein